jgi:hypothetical protein
MYSNDLNPSILQPWIIYSLLVFMLCLFFHETKDMQERTEVKVLDIDKIQIPVLPRELERDIFMVFARQYPKDAPKLALVARRVQSWYAISVARSLRAYIFITGYTGSSPSYMPTWY